MAVEFGAPRTGVAVALVSEILDAPDWDHVAARVLERYDDAALALAIFFLGGPHAAGEPRERLVELLREQYERHSGQRCPTGPNRAPMVEARTQRA